MSQANVRICDVKGCGLVGRTYFDVVIGERDDQGYHARYLEQVDFCGTHEHKYRMGLPEIKLKSAL